MDDWLPFSYTFLILYFDFPLGRAESGEIFKFHFFFKTSIF